MPSVEVSSIETERGSPHGTLDKDDPLNDAIAYIESEGKKNANTELANEYINELVKGRYSPERATTQFTNHLSALKIIQERKERELAWKKKIVESIRASQEQRQQQAERKKAHA